VQPSNDNHKNESEMIYSLAERFLPDRYLDKESRAVHIPVLHVIAAILMLGILGIAFYAIGKVGNQYIIDNSYTDNSKYIQSINVRNNPYVKDLRKWTELSREEKSAIKQEALIRFPQIKGIGNGVNWRPVAEWLAEDKGVIHSNPRDLFRDRASEPRDSH
jgi:hypothetical protein